MGSYTTGKYALYKAASSELVTPEQVLKNNFAIIDRIKDVIEYHVDTDTWPTPDDTINGIDCWKYYHQRSGKFFVVPFKLGGGVVVPKINNNNAWTNLTLVGAVTAYSANPIDAPAWRYADAANTIVQLKGKIAGGLTRNTAINVTNPGAVPNASGFSRLVHVPVSVSAANVDLNDMARIQIDTAGQIFCLRYGQSSMTDRYVDLSAVRYSTI